MPRSDFVGKSYHAAQTFHHPTNTDGARVNTHWSGENPTNVSGGVGWRLSVQRELGFKDVQQECKVYMNVCFAYI